MRCTPLAPSRVDTICIIRAHPYAQALWGGDGMRAVKTAALGCESCVCCLSRICVLLCRLQQAAERALRRVLLSHVRGGGVRCPMGRSTFVRCL